MSPAAGPSSTLFRVLGPVEHSGVDGWASVRAAKQRTLLATLLLNVNRTVPARQLYSELWGDRPHARSSRLLAGCVWRLRAVIGDANGTVLVTTASGYELSVPPSSIDLHTYETLIAQGRSCRSAHDLTGALESFTRALDVWRGDALADVAPTPSIMAEQSRLEESRLTVVEARCGVELDLGRHEEVLPELKSLVSHQPLRERLHGYLMTALYRCGQQAEALGAYRDLRRLLVDELGIEPSKPLRELRQRILLEDPALLPAATGPTRGPVSPSRSSVPGTARTAVPRLLPPAPRVFVGREAELRLLTGRLVEDNAVVSVHGVVGAGKTALALSAAHAVAGHFRDGQVKVDMRGSSGTPLRAIEAVHQVCEAFGVPTSPVLTQHDQRLPRWHRELSGRRVLLLLDDVLDMRQVGPLLSAPPGWTVLLTGCVAVGALEGGSHLRLDRLPAPAAVELLGFVVGTGRVADDRAAAARLAALCEYTPLALRIAADKLSARPDWRLADFADRLADSHTRLDLLTHGGNSVRDRLSSRRETLARRNDTAALRALDLLGALDLPLLTETELAVLLDTPATAAHLIAERLVDAGLLESPALGSYRVPPSVRLLAREGRTDPAAGQAAVRRVVDHYVEAVRDRVAGPVTSAPVRERAAWYRTHRSTLGELSLRDHTDTLYKAVSDLRRSLLDRFGCR